MPILQTCHLRPSGLAAASKFPRVVRTGAVAEGWAAATHAACWVVWLVMGAGSLVLRIGEGPPGIVPGIVPKKTELGRISGKSRSQEAVGPWKPCTWKGRIPPSQPAKPDRAWGPGRVGRR